MSAGWHGNGHDLGAEKSWSCADPLPGNHDLTSIPSPLPHGAPPDALQVVALPRSGGGHQGRLATGTSGMVVSDMISVPGNPGDGADPLTLATMIPPRSHLVCPMTCPSCPLGRRPAEVGQAS